MFLPLDVNMGEKIPSIGCIIYLVLRQMFTLMYRYSQYLNFLRFSPNSHYIFIHITIYVHVKVQRFYILHDKTTPNEKKKV